MEKIQNLFSSTTNNATESIANLSLDTIILIVIFLMFFTYAMKYGKQRIISLIFSFYILIPILSSFPYLQKISFFGDTEKAILYSKLGLSVLIIIFINIVIERMINWEFRSYGFRNLAENGLLAIASSGLLVAFSYHIIDISALYNFAPAVNVLFEPAVFFFWWLIAPIIVIFFTAKR